MVLLAAVEEAERMRQAALTRSELEEQLRRVWSHTYARYAAADAARLERVFVTRGVAVPTVLYPDPVRRRRLYQLALPPAYAAGFEPLADRIEAVLRSAVGFADLTAEARYRLLETIASVLESDPRFRFARIPTGVDWRDILRWWLQIPGCSSPPAEDVRDWLRVGTHEFEIRLGVAISSTLSLTWDRVRPDAAVPDLDGWRQLTGLPWAAFWLRELLAWGTLEPVTAFAIAAGRAASRLAAFPLAGAYRDWWHRTVDSDPEELYHPRSIRRWAEQHFPRDDPFPPGIDPAIPVRMTRMPTDATPHRLTVIPSVQDGETHWFDGAGYHLASSEHEDGDAGAYEQRDFALFTRESVVRVLR